MPAMATARGKSGDPELRRSIAVLEGNSGSSCNALWACEVDGLTPLALVL